MDNRKLNSRPANAVRVAWRVVQIQFMIAVAMSASAFMFYPFDLARSVLLGCITMGLPTLVLVRQLSQSCYGAGTQMLHAFYRGEALKWLLTIVFFVLTLRYGHISPGAYFIGLIGELLAYWGGFFLLYKEEEPAAPANSSDGGFLRGREHFPP